MLRGDDAGAPDRLRYQLCYELRIPMGWYLRCHSRTLWPSVFCEGGLPFNGVLRSSQAPLRGSGDVLPKQLLAPDADRGVAMDQFPFTVLPTEHAGITEGYLRAIG